MGGCAINRDKNEQIKASKFSIYSLDYKNNRILKYSQPNLLEYISISCEEHIPKQSAYIYNSPYIYVIGGSDDEKPIRNEVLKINIEEMTLEYLPTLPISSKHGEAYYHRDYLYYIGGAQLINYSVAPSPFLRLVKDGLAWEVLGPNIKTAKNINIASQLFRPGSCKINNCVYIIGGEIHRTQVENTMNESVYCFDLDTLTINIMEYEGLKIKAPRCISTQSGILVLGGFLENDINSSMWIIGKNQVKINEAGFKFNGNKPLHKILGCFVILGNQTIKKLKENKMTWKFQEFDPASLIKIGDIHKTINYKNSPLPLVKKTIYPQYFEEIEKSPNFESIRHESRKLSPSNLFNSGMDFDYSQTIQYGPQREISDSIFEI